MHEFPAWQAEERTWQIRRDAPPTVIADGPVAAWWDTQPPVEPTVRLRGWMTASGHAGTPPEAEHVTGTVRRVQVETMTYTLVEDSLVPVVGSQRLRNVRQSPRWFRATIQRDDGRKDHETGVLLDVDVPLLRPAAPTAPGRVDVEG